MKYDSLFSKLEKKIGQDLAVRRYNLSEMISESYKSLYECKKGSNLQRLVEAHLDDVRKNPKDIDRLSHQLSMLKEISRLTESGELKDEDLLVPKKSQDTVDPKKERALDLKESKDDEDVEEKDDNDVIDEAASPTYTWGDWQTERGSSCRVRYYSSGMDLTNQIIGIVYEETKEQPYYGAEIYDNSSASTIEERADDSYHFDTEKEAMEWVEEWFRANESVHDEDVEDTDLTDEEVEELTKHLAELRKNKKMKECDAPKKGVKESTKPRKLKRASESTKLRKLKRVNESTKPRKLKRASESTKLRKLKRVNESSDDMVDSGHIRSIANRLLELADDMDDKGLEGIYVESNNYRLSTPYVVTSVGFIDLSDVSKYTEEEDYTYHESASVWSRYHIVNPDGETIDSYTDRKDAEDWVNQLYKDGDYKRGDLKVVDSQAKNESKSYDKLNLSEFNKKSSSKAFVKTFKKLDKKLHEGTALTRQESISLYKAANSAMTQLSVELEHNPEFLDTFKECTSLLAKDVNSVLGSLKEGKAPSKKTMKSLAKFSETLLREDKVCYPNGEECKDDSVDMDKALDYQYGTDRDKDNSKYTTEEKQRALNYWIEKTDSNINEDEEEDLPPIEDEENEFISDEEGSTDSEESEEFDQEYADARVELHKKLVDEYADDENPAIQEKIAQDAEEVTNLPGITKEQISQITGDSVEDSEGSEEEIEDDISDEDITDDELSELKRYLKEMRETKKLKESKGRKLRKRR